MTELEEGGRVIIGPEHRESPAHSLLAPPILGEENGTGRALADETNRRGLESPSPSRAAILARSTSRSSPKRVLTRQQSLRQAIVGEEESEKHAQRFSRYEARTLFDNLDVDGEGELDIDDLQQYFAKGGMRSARDEVGVIITEMDTDGNGKIDFEEFLLLLKKLSAATGDEERFTWWDFIPSGPFCGQCMEETTPRTWVVWKRHIWLTVDDPAYSKLAWGIGLVLLINVLLSCTALIVGTVPPFPGPGDDVFSVIDAVTVAVFLIEFLVRVVSCPSLPKFFSDPLTYVDMCSILPYFVELFVGDSANRWTDLLRALRVVRVVRVFKLARFSESLQLLQRAFQASSAPLGMAFFLTLIGLLVFAAMIYFVERGTLDLESKVYIDEDGEKSDFQNVWDGFYWALITVTTVGYGDLEPKTPAGKVIGFIVMLAGTVLLGFPISIFSANFGDLYNMAARRRLLRMEMRSDIMQKLRVGQTREEKARKLPHFNLEEARLQAEKRAQTKGSMKVPRSFEEEDEYQQSLQIPRMRALQSRRSNADPSSPTKRRRRGSVETEKSVASAVSRLQLYERSSFMHSHGNGLRNSLHSMNSIPKLHSVAARPSIHSSRSRGGGGDSGGRTPGFWPTETYTNTDNVFSPEGQLFSPESRPTIHVPQNAEEVPFNRGPISTPRIIPEIPFQPQSIVAEEDAEEGTDGSPAHRGRAAPSLENANLGTSMDVTGLAAGALNDSSPAIVLDNNTNTPTPQNYHQYTLHPTSSHQTHNTQDPNLETANNYGGLDEQLRGLGAVDVSESSSVAGNDSNTFLTAASFHKVNLTSDESLAIAFDMLIHDTRKRVWREVRAIELTTRERLVLEIARRWRNWFDTDHETITQAAREHVSSIVDVYGAIAALSSPIMRSSFAISPRNAIELSQTRDANNFDDSSPPLQSWVSEGGPHATRTGPRRGLGASPAPKTTMSRRSIPLPLRHVSEGNAAHHQSTNYSDVLKSKDEEDNNTTSRSPRVEEVRTKRTVHRRIVDPVSGRTKLVTEETTEVVRRVTSRMHNKEKAWVPETTEYIPGEGEDVDPSA